MMKRKLMGALLGALAATSAHAVAISGVAYVDVNVLGLTSNMDISPYWRVESPRFRQLDLNYYGFNGTYLNQGDSLTLIVKFSNDSKYDFNVNWRRYIFFVMGDFSEDVYDPIMRNYGTMDLYYHGNLISHNSSYCPGCMSAFYDNDNLTSPERYIPNNIGPYDEMAVSMTINSVGGRYVKNIRIGSVQSAPNMYTWVPEPASWTMMIAGFGLIGTALRSRRRSFAG